MDIKWKRKSAKKSDMEGDQTSEIVIAKLSVIKSAQEVMESIELCYTLWKMSL